MIGKIDPGAILEKALSPSLSTPKKEGPDFYSLLKEKIEDSAPLERMALEFLKKAVKMALSDTNPEQVEFFPSPSLLLPLKLPASPKLPSPPPGTENQPQLFEVESVLDVSENLQGEQNFEYIVHEAGERYGVAPSLIRAVIQVESGGNALAVSKAGARGLMQLMPGTAAELGVTNPFDPVENIMGGARYLRQLLNRYRGDIKLALAAYNWGMGNLEKLPEAMPQETRNFISKVERLHRDYSKA